eukprot:3360087-Prymnesium_polylepis.1
MASLTDRCELLLCSVWRSGERRTRCSAQSRRGWEAAARQAWLGSRPWPSCPAPPAAARTDHAAAEPWCRPQLRAPPLDSPPAPPPPYRACHGSEPPCPTKVSAAARQKSGRPTAHAAPRPAWP